MLFSQSNNHGKYSNPYVLKSSHPQILRLVLAACLVPSIAGAQTPKQAVFETSLGTFVVELLPEAAPNQVAYFTKLAQDGGYDGTTFHAMFKNGMVQGGDPLSKDPSKKSLYGTGGQ